MSALPYGTAIAAVAAILTHPTPNILIAAGTLHTAAFILHLTR